jgi:tetratricopeptide (TPR) repeat protein
MFYTFRIGIVSLIVLISALVFPLTLRAKEPSLTREQIHTLFRRGENFFRRADTLAATNPREAKTLYLQALLRFEKIVNAGGIRNGRLFYDIGNAYFRRGELGRAILYYKRAEKLIPRDSHLRQNLEYVRSLRRDKIKEKPESRFLGTLFFRRYGLNLKTEFILFVIFFDTLWILALITLLIKKNLPLKIGIYGTGILAAVFLFSLSLSSFLQEKYKEGVIVSAQVVARKGDGESYRPSFREPLHQGTEFILLEKRVGWWHIQLPDGREGWIPGRDAESV